MARNLWTDLWKENIMNWMTWLFLVEAVLYAVCLVVIACAIRDEWREECEERDGCITPIFVFLLFIMIVAIIFLVADGFMAYWASGSWDAISTKGLLVLLCGSLSTALLICAASWLVRDLFRESSGKFSLREVWRPTQYLVQFVARGFFLVLTRAFVFGKLIL